MIKKFSSVIAVYAIAVVLFSVLFFVAPFEKIAATITSYCFVLVAAGLSIFLTIKSFSNGQEVKSKVYGFPIFRVGIITFIAQLVFTLIIFVAAFWVVPPMWVTIVVPIFILGFGVIGAIAAETTRIEIERQENEFARQLENTSYFKLDMSYIVDICKEGELKKAVSKLAESIRYSDPVSSPATAELEGRISSAISELEGLVSSDSASAMEKVSEISRLLADRNRRCKENKK